LFERVHELGYNIKLTAKAKDFVAEKGYDEKFGARPLKRAIQKYLEDPLADEIINSKITEGDEINVDYNKKEDKIVIKIKKGKPTEPEGKEVTPPPVDEAKASDKDGDDEG
jgi:ATP-dependent Clp protease ATP-binding subunit ClpC